MRKKMAVLSALTCVVGGSALLTPASGQATLAPCSNYIGKACSRSSPQYQQCTQPDGSVDYVMCYQGWWIWA